MVFHTRLYYNNFNYCKYNNYNNNNKNCHSSRKLRMAACQKSQESLLMDVVSAAHFLDQIGKNRNALSICLSRITHIMSEFKDPQCAITVLLKFPERCVQGILTICCRTGIGYAHVKEKVMTCAGGMPLKV